MEYEIKKLAAIAGITTRTLRYYDQIGLLKPARITTSNYRIYGEKEVDTLQQILLYRQMKLPLEEIKTILGDPNFNQQKTLQQHLANLKAQQTQIQTLIENVEKTISSIERNTPMNNNEKFQGFKQQLINDNETQYGKEIREKYGNETIDQSNQKLSDMTQEQYNNLEELTTRLNDTIKAAFEEGNPEGKLAQQACQLHKQWLCHYWPDGMYTKEAHMSLTQAYVDDHRFTAYYDKIAPGCAVFLRNAMRIYTGIKE